MSTFLPDYAELHCVSNFSFLRGASHPEELAARAAALGYTALAITDANNLFGALEFSEKISKEGIQPIVGIQLTVDLGDGALFGGRGDPRSAGRLPLVLLAQSEEGYMNLMDLGSRAWIEPEPGDLPHVTLAQIASANKGLIALTGGPSGPLDRAFHLERPEVAEARLSALEPLFDRRLYVELQRHGMPSERETEPFLLDLAYRRGLPLVASNEPFFAARSEYDAHDALLCIAEGTIVSDPNRRQLTPEHRFKTREEMQALFADLPEATQSTVEIALRCAYRPQTRKPILPRFTTGEGAAADAEAAETTELRRQAMEGLENRLAAHGPAPGQSADDYRERLEFELGIITRMKFPGYFLIVADFIKWAKSHGIPVGPGRGSGAGSLVAWALTITNLDPLRFGLLFERFLNPERVSMPDFDIDFCQERREEVISYVQQRYGVDRVAQIITFGTLQARAVLRDVGRVMQLPLGMVDRLAKMVPSNPANPVTLAQAIEIEPRLKEARRDDDSVARLLETALHLEGLFRNASTHAAGVVIGDRPLTELTPLYQDPRSELPATQYNMKWVESAGLVKFDFLGLKTLTVVDRAHKHLLKRGAATDLDALPLDDAATYALLASGQTIGVFQLESQGMRDTLRKMRCSTIEEITALISLYRPGPMDNIDTYVDRKFGRAELDMLHPSLEPILKETYGVIIYQEQVMQIAQVLSGYSLGEADLLRRAMGKKKKEEMDFQKARFVAGASDQGVDPAQADFIFELVAKFAGYGFNKSHAAAYAMIAYQTGWLKANRPVEFFAASMSLDLSNTDKLAVFYQDAKRFGVKILPPDINRSGADFEVEDGAVLYAMGAVRNVGFEAMRHVEQIRRAGGPFVDLFDFVERIDPRLVNKRALESLARAGAFDRLHPNRAQILASADQLMAHAQSLSADRAAAQESLFADASVARPRLPSVEPWTGPEQLDEELSAVGFYLTGHPLEDMAEVMRRKRVVLMAEAQERAEAGEAAFRMAGIIRRKQERPSQSGEKFAYVTLSDPTGEFEVMFMPEALRTYRDMLEPGRAVMIKVRARAREGEIRFMGVEAELMDKVVQASLSGLRIHVTPDPAVLAVVRRRLEAGRSDRGGEMVLVAALGQGREVELKLPGRYSMDASLRGALKSAQGVTYLEDV